MNDTEKPMYLKINKVLTEFRDRQEYMEFLSEYQDNKHELEGIKHQLANM